jgi:hypothetical protein
MLNADVPLKTAMKKPNTATITPTAISHRCQNMNLFINVSLVAPDIITYILRQTNSPLPMGTMRASTRSSANALSNIGFNSSRLLMALSATSNPPLTNLGTTIS